MIRSAAPRSAGGPTPIPLPPIGTPPPAESGPLGKPSDGSPLPAPTSAFIRRLKTDLSSPTHALQALMSNPLMPKAQSKQLLAMVDPRYEPVFHRAQDYVQPLPPGAPLPPEPFKGGEPVEPRVMRSAVAQADAYSLLMACPRLPSEQMAGLMAKLPPEQQQEVLKARAPPPPPWEL